MEDMSRAIRRHHAARIKRARKFYFGRDNSGDPVGYGMLLHTATPCSCWMCGNPRRFGGVTLGEILQRVILAEGM